MEISAPKTTQKALDKLVGEMYISNVSKRLRELNQPNDIDRKRWIWELLQNAKDTIANNPQRDSIKARILIEGDCVKFQHNGDPFTADARLGLLYKYSEDKENAESTGRFGTGFLTTHCLSKIVSIESNMYGDDNKIIGFSVTMFRDGFTKSELIKGLEKMRKTEKYESEPYQWTTYTYHVNTESGRRAILLGKDNFKENIAQVLLFCKELSSVELIDNGERTFIERSSDNQITDTIYEAKFRIVSGETSIVRAFIYCKSSETDEELSQKYKTQRSIRIQTACEVDANKNIVSTDDKTSLFCVFPLVGIEGQLQMPIYVNSPDFEPDSERQSLILNGDTIDEEKGIITEVGINQKIFSKLPDMFRLIVEYLSLNSYNNFFNLCNGLKSIKDHEKLDKEWYKDNIVSALRAILTSYPIAVPYATEVQSLKKLSECVIATEKKLDGEKGLFGLLTSLCPGKLIANNHEWAQALWKDDDIKLWNTEDVCKEIADERTMESLAIVDDMGKYAWYNEFLSFVLSQNELLLKNYAILPNMNGEFLKKDEVGFKQGEGLTDTVLDVLAELDGDMRPMLLHESITAVALDSKFNSISYSAKANSLAKDIIKSSLTDEEKRYKLKPLISILPSDKGKYEQDFINKRSCIFRITKELFEWSELYTVTDNSLNKAAWETTDVWLIGYTIKTIESKKTLANLPIGLGAEWLNGVIMGLGITLAQMNKIAIVPNQNGEFCFSKDLFIDEGIPEILKNDVFGKVGLSYKDILLDEAIDLKALGKTSAKKITDFATDLNTRLAGYSSRSKVVTCSSYNRYRRYDESTLQEVAQYLIQILPATDDDGICSRQTALRDIARFFLGERCCGVNETIDFTDNKLWEKINSFICWDIVRKIEEKGTISDITNDLSTDEETLFGNLNVLYKFIQNNNFPVAGESIYPNQSGTFATMNSLYAESKPIDKQLKDIIALISDEKENYYNILIDPRCEVAIERKKSSVDAYTCIDDRVKKLYGGQDNWEDKDFKKAAHLLIDEWGDKNKALFDANHFPKIYPIKDSISMNVVWTKNERQQLQTLKNKLNEEDLTSLVSHIEEVKDLGKRNKELVEENKRLREKLKKLKAGETAVIKRGEDDPISKRQMYEAQCEAQQKLMETRRDWKYPKHYGETDEEGKPYHFSTVEVKDENGQSLHIVLKSYKSRQEKFKINAEEWKWVAEYEAKLLVYTTMDGVLDIVEIPQNDLVMNQSNISITFSSENLDMEQYAERVSSFSETLHYFKELHFDFEQFHIEGNAKRVKDIHAKHSGSQNTTSDDDL